MGRVRREDLRALCVALALVVRSTAREAKENWDDGLAKGRRRGD